MNNIKGNLCTCGHNDAMHDFGHGSCAYCECKSFTQPNQYEDKELEQLFFDKGMVLIYREVKDELVQLITQKQLEAEKLGAFMAASAILTEMSPLMVHRLERGFPEMTAQVIGNVYEQVKKEMKPYQDKRKAELTKQEGKG